MLVCTWTINWNFIWALSLQAAVQTWHWHQADNICKGYSVKTRVGKSLKSLARSLYHGPWCLHRTYHRKLRQLGMFVQLPSLFHAYIHAVHTAHTSIIHRWILHVLYWCTVHLNQSTGCSVWKKKSITIKRPRWGVQIDDGALWGSVSNESWTCGLEETGVGVDNLHWCHHSQCLYFYRVHMWPI